MYGKREGSARDLDPYLWLVDPDPGGPKTCGSCGSGSPTLVKKVNLNYTLSLPTVRLRSVALIDLYWWDQRELNTAASSTATWTGWMIDCKTEWGLMMDCKTEWWIGKDWTRIYCEKGCGSMTLWCGSGSMTFWCGSGSGPADPCLWLMDPDPGSGFSYFCHWPFKMPTRN